MPVWLWVIDSLAVLVLLAFVFILWLVFRRWLVARRSQTPFDLSVSVDDLAHAQGWTMGFAVYRGPELHWYRTLSVSVRPKHRFARSTLHIGARRDPAGSELHVLQTGAVVVAVNDPSGVRQVAMSPAALTGLLSWLESSPPGERVNNVV